MIHVDRDNAPIIVIKQSPGNSIGEKDVIGDKRNSRDADSL